MTVENKGTRSSVASALFNLLDPIPFGFFVGALIFDIVYMRSANVFWVKGAAWLVSIGLVIAIVPQLINLSRVWFGGQRVRSGAVVTNFWLNVAGIVAALFNAFVHTRDAYGTMPAAVWLSAATVIALGVGRIILAGRDDHLQGVRA